MTGIVTALKALSPDAQTEACPQNTAVFNAAKDARRLQPEAEIRSLGFKPGEGRKKPERAPKYVGPNGEVWTGVGTMASWLRNSRLRARTLKGLAAADNPLSNQGNNGARAKLERVKQAGDEGLDDFSMAAGDRQNEGQCGTADSERRNDDCRLHFISFAKSARRKGVQGFL
jgi:hypothetical protein